MTALVDSAFARDADRLHRLHEAKARAELAAADLLAPGADRVAWRGSPLASIAVVKGLPGAAEAAGDAAMAGPDGAAAIAALDTLGHEEPTVFFTLSRPEPGTGRKERVARLRAQLEAVGAELVIAVDAEAAEDVAGALGLQALGFGKLESTRGRRIVALEGLEASLGDPRLKRRVWNQFRVAVPPPSVF